MSEAVPEPEFDFEAIETACDRLDKLSIPYRCLGCPSLKMMTEYHRDVQASKYIAKKSVDIVANGLPDDYKQQIREQIEYYGAVVSAENAIAEVEANGRERVLCQLDYLDKELEGINAFTDDMTSNCEGPLEMSAIKNGVKIIMKACASSGDIAFPEATEVTRVITAQPSDD